MPNVGDQHISHGVSNTNNPFEEPKPHVSQYTAQEIATLSSRLEKQLGPEYISSRPGAGGGKVHYLAADKCINLANEVFGFNGWSSGIQQVDIDFVDENPSTGKVSLGLSVIVRVTLRDGTYHEDIGYGHIENCKGKAPAFEKAKKEGTTDGLKRALRNFGNLLGNCVYDKDYVARVTKLRVAPSKWDPEHLHRHSDFVPIKREADALPTTTRDPNLRRMESHEDEFGSDDFDEVDFAVPEGEDPDGVTVGNGVESQHFRRRSSFPGKQHRSPVTNTIQANIRSNPPGPQTPSAASLPAPLNPSNNARPVNPVNGAARVAQPQRLNQAPQQPRLNVSNGSNAPLQPPHQSSDRPPNIESSSSSSTHEPPVGFFTARAAESLQNAQGNSTLPAPSFNPHLESPSIRKTAGIDHTKTKPINRDILGAPASAMPSAVAMPSPAAARAGNPGLVNPQADKNRKVGMPSVASPLQNRGSYKPPQMKRPAEAGARSALGDVTNATVNITNADGTVDAKRQRMGTENGQATGALNA